MNLIQLFQKERNFDLEVILSLWLYNERWTKPPKFYCPLQAFKMINPNLVYNPRFLWWGKKRIFFWFSCKLTNLSFNNHKLCTRSRYCLWEIWWRNQRLLWSCKILLLSISLSRDLTKFSLWTRSPSLCSILLP